MYATINIDRGIMGCRIFGAKHLLELMLIFVDLTPKRCGNNFLSK